MKHFLIVTNDGKDKEYKVTDHVKNLLEQAGMTCVICEKDEKKQIIREAVPKEIDCAIVIGGDGSFIEAARVLEERDIPILGINMGTLGYLTEVELNHIDEAIEKVVNGEYSLEERMMLEGEFQNGDSNVALNDIVVSRKGALRVIHFRLFVNGELLNSYKADGIILSTPTGSTAYNLSAGGPIVEPTSHCFIVTPVCAHQLSVRAMVLDAGRRITVQLPKGNRKSLYLSIDGGKGMRLTGNERVEICLSQHRTQLVQLVGRSFYQVVNQKLGGYAP